MLQRFVDDDQGYLAWIGAHPDGFVMNAKRRPTRSFVVVHVAACPTLHTATPPEGWTSTMIKVCATTKAEIDGWCLENVSGNPTRCRSCRP